MGVVLLFSGVSLNNVMTNRVRLDAELLRECGHTAIIADLTQPCDLPDPATLDLIIGYQGWGHDIKMSDQSLYVEQAGCPFIVTLGDHPIHHAARVLACPNNTVFCVSSRNQIAFLRDVLQVSADIRLLPSSMSDGGESCLAGSVERDIDTLVIGQVTSPDVFLAGHNLPDILEAVVREFVERAQHDPFRDPVFEYMRSGYQRVASLAGNQQAALGVGRLVDLMVRHAFRWGMVETLRTLPVTFVGDDWKKLERRSSDAFLALPSVPYRDLPSTYARSKLCLNLHAPHFDFHERILDGMAQSTAVATPQTKWLTESFSFGEEILALPADPKELPQWMDEVHADPAKLAQIGERGREAAVARFGCQAPVDLFLDVLGEEPQMASKANMSRPSDQAAELASAAT
eukprot:s1_g1079.t1